MNVWRSFILRLVRFFLSPPIHGLSNMPLSEGGGLIVANHPGLIQQWGLVAMLLGHIQPKREERFLFLLHPQTVAPSWLRPLITGLFSPWVTLVTVDPTDQKEGESLASATQRLEDHLRHGGKAMVFPTLYPAKMRPTPKYYGWSLLSAQQAHAPVLTLHKDLFSGEITLLPPRYVDFWNESQAEKTTDHRRDRRQAAAQQAQDLLGEAALRQGLGRYTLWNLLCRASHRYGRHRLALTDNTGKKATYGQLLFRSLLLGQIVARQTQANSYVGILLPTSVGSIITFFALHAFGRTPALLNFTAGSGPLCSACQTARISVVYSSRLFVRKAGLDALVTALEKQVTVIFLEDVRRLLTPWKLFLAGMLVLFPQRAYRYFCPTQKPAHPAVVLFTSGSEGDPKGVVLSHDNLVANALQIHARIDIQADDVMLNVLPMFHAFGLTVGSLFPLFAGIRSHCLSSPLEYALIPDRAYAVQASLMAGTDTFLAGYARTADARDFFRMRYVFSGAEPLRQETQRLWMERFGIRILEGYGTTEASPVLAVNTPMACRTGSVGRLLPGIAYHLEPVPGLSPGALLCVRGPNIMLGYLLPGKAGIYHFPDSGQGDGWYDSGDIVTVDPQGFIYILGRAKRFAKIAGEMISLAAVEHLATQVWPEWRHAVVCCRDARKGEYLVLVSEHPTPDRSRLLQQIQIQGLGNLYLPKKLLSVESLPLLGSGKVDFAAIVRMVASLSE